MPPVNGHRYLPSTAVFLAELLKLALSLTISLTDISRTLPPSAPVTSLFSALVGAVFSGDSWKLALPAVLYTLSNSLTYVGVGNLSPATFMVVWQVRVLVTAVGIKVLLGRGLSARKWGALILLMVGVGIVVMGCAGGGVGEDGMVESTRLFPKSLDFLGLGGSSTSKRMTKRSATYEGIAEDELMGNPALNLNKSLGVVATSLAAICSGFASVYFERILKDSVTSASPSLWIRNVQLAVYSLFPALFIGVVFLDGELIAKNGFFQGWSLVVWAAVGAQALGGVVAAFCVYYADCVVKNFATGGAIVASAVAGMWFFGGDVSGNVSDILSFPFYLWLLKSSPQAITDLRSVLPRHDLSPPIHVPVLLPRPPPRQTSRPLELKTPAYPHQLERETVAER
jgi:hypothetical protein